MSMQMKTKASITAEYYHCGQMYGADPYMRHINDVVVSVERAHYEPESVVVAYLHDILEDTACKPAEIQTKFGGDVFLAVLAITKNPNEEYEDYIKRVRTNRIARVVKIHDTLCNLTESVKNRNQYRIGKYSKQILLLNE